MTKIQLEKKVIEFLEKGGKVEKLQPTPVFLQIELEAEAYLKNPSGQTNEVMLEIEALTSL
tara:strand:- start:381 stop:563 length:183 start_codon:yes stop_codon:yes gene_type:complete